ncbi:MAG: Rne/Rng family ribonuclease [Rickettsiales bacterium]|nr:Rne/Rng family ribonuclease [Rickettsiales bacterium]
MTKRMLIDATHELETRVAILEDDIIEHYDFVSSAKRQLKGNIYLGKITRIEPSLQAAFVEYGGSKQGFLSFSEIHPDYYQIPIADRKRLMEDAAREAEEDAAREARAEREDDGNEPDENQEPSEAPQAKNTRPRRTRQRTPRAMAPVVEEGSAEDAADVAASLPELDGSETTVSAALDVTSDGNNAEAEDTVKPAPKPRARRRPFAAKPKNASAPSMETSSDPIGEEDMEPVEAEDHDLSGTDERDAPTTYADSENDHDGDSRDREIETVSEEDVVKPRPYAFRRYKIQEVIKPNQIVLVQVIKEERGNKGCSLSTYISLPGRYCVLMPNSPKDGGISRKIGTGSDRKRLKDIAAELKESRGMSAIIRTAGIDRSRTEIKRDYEYLIKLWNTTRDLALSSSAPALVYEEGDIVKRTIRDYYNGDIAEVLVQGESAHRSAKDFMKMIMASHAARVKHFQEKQPLFSAYGVEEQLADLYNPIAPLPSGGYLVINPTEALISIDVNSGRSTTERNVEETAFKTNLEAAEEVARQLRLRDLGGLVVIDFIDMGYGKHRRAVERVLKDSLKSDRAKVQVGHISAFGLMELSRQRLGPSIFETTTITCSHCTGTGHVRSPDATSVSLIRELESMAFEGQTEIRVRMTAIDSLCLLNRYRHEIARIEQTYPALKLSFDTDDGLLQGTYAFGSAPAGGEPRKDVARRPIPPRRRGRKNGGRNGKPSRGLYQSSDPVDHEPIELDPEDEIDEELASDEQSSPESAENDETGDPDRNGKRRSRRGRRGGRGRNDSQASGDASLDRAEGTRPAGSEASDDAVTSGDETAENSEQGGRRRRGRRGGRGRGPRREGQEAGNDVTGASHDTHARVSHAEIEPNVSVSETPPPAPRETAEPQRMTHNAPLPSRTQSDEPSPRPIKEDTVIDDNQPKRRGWWSKITG